MRVLAFAAVKGGVGKTTAAVNVAAAAAQSGVATLLWDLDAQAAACHLAGVDPVAGRPPKAGWFRRRTHHSPLATSTSGLSVIPADITLGDRATRTDVKHLTRVVARESEHRELIVLDLPAGVDAAVEAAVGAGADIVVPIVPSMLSVRSFDQFVEFVHRSERPRPSTVCGFVSMADPTLKRHADFVADLSARRPDVLATWIPETVEIERACERRLPVSEVFPGGRAAAAFAALWDELSS